MDTDDLSTEAYKAILSEAEKFSHDLTLHYGLLSYNCHDETEYLDKSEQLTMQLLSVNNKDHLEDLFWGNRPDINQLKKTLKKILSNIHDVRKIPVEKRHFEW